MDNESHSFPDGPEGHWLAGNYPEFRQDVLGFMEESAQTFGDLVGLKIFHMDVLLVNRPDLIQTVLQQSEDKVRKPWDLRQLKFFLGEGLLTSDGDNWQKSRTNIQPAFRHDTIHDYADHMTQEARKLLTEWSDGEERDIHREMASVTLQVIARSLFGSGVEDYTDVVGQSMRTIQEQFVETMTAWVPMPFWVPTPGHLKAFWAKRNLDDVIHTMINRSRKNESRVLTVMDVLLEAQDENPDHFTDERLRDEVMTLFVAGHETTALALTWTFYLLDDHTEVEQRILEELDAVLDGSQPEGDDFQELEYTRKVIKESMRLYPPAWGIGREVSEPMELEGYRIPEGTQIFMSQYVMHRDERYFEEPEIFSPSRWDDEFSSELPKFAYFPFGGGPRVCIGAHFAMLEAVLILATILQDYRINVLEDRDIELLPAVTLRPKDGIDVRLEKRL
ncbi:MAG: cytochrome P450 [bacterium]